MKKQLRENSTRLRLTARLTVLLILMGAMLSCDTIPDILRATSPTIKIGLVLPIPRRINTQYGAELAVAEINQQGGVLDHSVELIVKNDQGDKVRGKEVAGELIQEEVIAILGPNFSSVAVEVAPLAQQSGVPMITTTATNPTITQAGDFVFQAAFTDDFQGQVMAQFAKLELNAQTAAILTQADDVYSEGLSEIFNENFIALGGEIVAHESYAAGDTDFTTQLQAIAAEAPDVVFMPGFAEEVACAVQQARAIPVADEDGNASTFIGGDAWGLGDLFQKGTGALEGSYFSTHFSSETTVRSGRNFVDAYRSVFGTAPDGAAAMGYDVVKLVATAIRRAGTLEQTAIRDQIAATQDYRGATSLLRYNENRHPIKSAVIEIITDGQVRFFDQVEPRRD
jgi:branched-chain amino acid transport system substrate-binding protein